MGQPDPSDLPETPDVDMGDDDDWRETDSEGEDTRPDHSLPQPPSPRTFARNFGRGSLQQLAVGDILDVRRPETPQPWTEDNVNLRDALYQMFDLPPIPLRQQSTRGSAEPMDHVSQAQSRRSESRHSPSTPSIPATRPRSPEEPEPGPSEKRPNTWDLKDPAHPLHRWGAQQAYKEHIEQSGYEYLGSPQRSAQPSPRVSPTHSSPRGSDLESIPEEDQPLPPEPAPPTTMPGALSPTSPSDPAPDPVSDP